MRFFIKSKDDTYYFVIEKKESGKSQYVVKLIYPKCCNDYTVEKIIINDDKFTIKLNPNSKGVIINDIRKNFIDLSYDGIIINYDTKIILQQKDIFSVISGPKINIPVAQIKQAEWHHPSIYNIGIKDDYEDESYFARALIEMVTTTKQGEIAIVLNTCREAFYDCLQGDNNLKKKYFSYICWYNSIELTQSFDQLTKAAHYLLIAYIFKFYEKYGKYSDKTDSLFRIKPEEVITFINKHLKSNKETLFLAIQNDLYNQTPILKLVKKENKIETTNFN